MGEETYSTFHEFKTHMMDLRRTHSLATFAANGEDIVFKETDKFTSAVKACGNLKQDVAILTFHPKFRDSAPPKIVAIVNYLMEQSTELLLNTTYFDDPESFKDQIPELRKVVKTNTAVDVHKGSTIIQFITTRYYTNLYIRSLSSKRIKHKIISEVATPKIIKLFSNF